MKYEIILPAEDDLIDIWNYTLSKWGESQADSYVRGVILYFEKIADEEVFYRQLPLASARVKYVIYKHHKIFFLSDKKPIILGVLHEKMDFIVKLKKRLSV